MNYKGYKGLLCFVTGTLLAVSFAEAKSTESVVMPTKALEAAVSLEEAFNYVASKARPSVVFITNIQYQGDGGQMPDIEEFFLHPFQRRRYRPQGRSHRRWLRPAGTGSGAIISKDGYIVTNHHVIDGCEYLRVKLADGTEYDNQKNPDDVKIIGVDKETDLAVLRIGGGKKTDFAALEYADINKVKVGQWAIAIGAPHGLEQSVTIGNVSQLGRHNMGLSTFDNYIQTDAPLNPGNSGGPLLNIHGEIIGVNQFIHTDGMGKGNIGLGFAIASDLAKQVTDALIQDGEVLRPFIGITMQSMTPELKEQFGVKDGVLVADVLEGEAAEKAGVKSGDVIVKLNGKAVSDHNELLRAITKYKPGASLTLTIMRDGKEKDIVVVAGKRDLVDNDYKGRKSSDSVKEDDRYSKLGLELEVVDESVVVRRVLPDGAAAENASRASASVREGDIILEVNRQSVNSVSDVRKALGKTRNNVVVLLIERQMRGRAPWRNYITIPLD